VVGPCGPAIGSGRKVEEPRRTLAGLISPGAAARVFGTRIPQGVAGAERLSEAPGVTPRVMALFLGHPGLRSVSRDRKLCVKRRQLVLRGRLIG
jgi:hypothetical protein